MEMFFTIFGIVSFSWIVTKYAMTPIVEAEKREKEERECRRVKKEVNEFITRRGA